MSSTILNTLNAWPDAGRGSLAPLCRPSLYATTIHQTTSDLSRRFYARRKRLGFASLKGVGAERTNIRHLAGSRSVTRTIGEDSRAVNLTYPDEHAKSLDLLGNTPISILEHTALRSLRHRPGPRHGPLTVPVKGVNLTLVLHQHPRPPAIWRRDRRQQHI
jgi:hypothetical protein